MQTIDITPSWRAIVPTLVHVAAHATTPDSREAAMQELLRLADAVDQLNESARKADHADHA